MPSELRALFALLLAPWERWVGYEDVGWRAFRIPWTYAVDDDLFCRPEPLPSADDLSWEPAMVGDSRDAIEIEWPLERNRVVL